MRGPSQPEMEATADTVVVGAGESSWMRMDAGRPLMALTRPGRGLDRSAAFVGDPDSSIFDNARAVSHDLALSRRKPAIQKIKQFGRESREEQGIGTAVLACIGEYFKCQTQSMVHPPRCP